MSLFLEKCTMKYLEERQQDIYNLISKKKSKNTENDKSNVVKC